MFYIAKLPFNKSFKKRSPGEKYKPSKFSGRQIKFNNGFWEGNENFSQLIFGVFFSECFFSLKEGGLKNY